jgi:hypothetical protein
MPCYRCGVRQTDPGRGQSPWKRGVVRHSQILICPGCQDAADWTAELDRCSRCSSVRLVKRLGEVECRDCGAIVAPEGAGQAEFADDPGGARPEGGSGAAGTDPEGAGLESAGLESAGRGADLSEEVARALDRVLGRSLVSQSIQRAPDPEGTAGPGAAGPGAGSGGSRAASAGSRAGAGRRRPARPESGRHAAADPAAERHRASRPSAAGADAASLDAIRPGAFAG